MIVTPIPDRHKMAATGAIFVPHHQPPLTHCEGCQESLRARASQQICGLLYSPQKAKPQAEVFRSRIKSNVRLPTWENILQANTLSPSQLSPFGTSSSKDSSPTKIGSSALASPTGPQSSSPANGRLTTAADLAESFYRTPNMNVPSTPLYHPRPSRPLTANAISWVETRPAFYTVIYKSVQAPSPAPLCRPNAIAPLAGAIVAKISEVRYGAVHAEQSARLYTRDLVDEDDVKIFSWERIFRGKIQPCCVESNSALCPDAEVDHNRAEMTILAEDGRWCTSPVELPECAEASNSTNAPDPVDTTSPPSQLPMISLPPGLVTYPSIDPRLYDDAEVISLIDHAHRIGMEHEGLNVKTAAVRSPVEASIVTWRGDSNALRLWQ